jgi:hypothetical protein
LIFRVFARRAHQQAMMKRAARAGKRIEASTLDLRAR